MAYQTFKTRGRVVDSHPQPYHGLVFYFTQLFGVSLTGKGRLWFWRIRVFPNNSRWGVIEKCDHISNQLKSVDNDIRVEASVPSVAVLLVSISVTDKPVQLAQESNQIWGSQTTVHRWLPQWVVVSQRVYIAHTFSWGFQPYDPRHKPVILFVDRSSPSEKPKLPKHYALYEVRYTCHLIDGPALQLMRQILSHSTATQPLAVQTDIPTTKIPTRFCLEDSRHRLGIITHLETK